MFKKILAILLTLFAAAAFAAVDANKATQAELESVKGIGPAIAGKILDARKTAAFKDWPDLIDRVKGIGEGNAAKFSEAGLTVGGSGFKGAAPAAKKDTAMAMAMAKAKAKANANTDTKTADAKAAEPAASKPAKKSKKDKADAAADAASKPAKQ